MNPMDNAMETTTVGPTMMGTEEESQKLPFPDDSVDLASSYVAMDDPATVDKEDGVKTHLQEDGAKLAVKTSKKASKKTKSTKKKKSKKKKEHKEQQQQQPEEKQQQTWVNDNNSDRQKDDNPDDEEEGDVAAVDMTASTAPSSAGLSSAALSSSTSLRGSDGFISPPTAPTSIIDGEHCHHHQYHPHHHPTYNDASSIAAGSRTTGTVFSSDATFATHPSFNSAARTRTSSSSPHPPTAAVPKKRKFRLKEIEPKVLPTSQQHHSQQRLMMMSHPDFPSVAPRSDVSTLEGSVAFADSSVATPATYLLPSSIVASTANSIVAPSTAPSSKGSSGRSSSHRSGTTSSVPTDAVAVLVVGDESTQATAPSTPGDVEISGKPGLLQLVEAAGDSTRELFIEYLMSQGQSRTVADQLADEFFSSSHGDGLSNSQSQRRSKYVEQLPQNSTSHHRSTASSYDDHDVEGMSDSVALRKAREAANRATLSPLDGGQQQQQHRRNNSVGGNSSLNFSATDLNTVGTDTISMLTDDNGSYWPGGGNASWPGGGASRASGLEGRSFGGASRGGANRTGVGRHMPIIPGSDHDGMMDAYIVVDASGRSSRMIEGPGSTSIRFSTTDLGTSGATSSRRSYPHHDRLGMSSSSRRHAAFPHDRLGTSMSADSRSSRQRHASAYVMEARTVDSPPKQNPLDDMELVFAESVSTKQSSMHQVLTHPGPWRRIIYVGCAFVIVCIIVSVILIAMTMTSPNDEDKGDGSSADPAGDSSPTPVPVDLTDAPVPSLSPSIAPSAMPSFLSPDLLTIATSLSGEIKVGSPQHDALGWLSSRDKMTKADDAVAFTQRYAVVVVYYSLGGPEWGNQTGWLDANKHECDWGPDISCDVEGDRRTVAGLYAVGNQLQGTLPTELGLLYRLQWIDLNNNALGGTLPSQLFQMVSLNQLELSNNDFEGTLPKNMRSAASLQTLGLGSNRLEGTIPDSFFYLTLLRDVNFAENQLTGTLAHPNFDRLVGLKTFRAQNNTFVGPLPNITREIDVLKLDHNLLTGTIPLFDPTGFIVKQELTLSHNSFSGTITATPTAAGNRPAALLELSLFMSGIGLRKLDLSYNTMTGTLPPGFGMMPLLSYFDVSGNVLTGRPFAVHVEEQEEWPSLEYFALRENQFTGKIPVTNWTGRSTKVTHLDVSHNFFRGPIPELSAFPELRYLDVSNNTRMGPGPLPNVTAIQRKLQTFHAENCGLTGTIPPSYGSVLTSLEVLQLRNNRLEGLLPLELRTLVQLQELDVTSNKLTGPLKLLGEEQQQPGEETASSSSPLVNLQILSLANNDFTGTISSASFTGLVSLQHLELQNNARLQGTLDSQVCDMFPDGLPRQHVGCTIQCSCCFNSPIVCNTSSRRIRRQTL